TSKEADKTHAARAPTPWFCRDTVRAGTTVARHHTDNSRAGRELGSGKHALPTGASRRDCADGGRRLRARADAAGCPFNAGRRQAEFLGRLEPEQRAERRTAGSR